MTPSRAACAGWAHRIRRAIPGDYRIEIGPDPNRVGQLMAQVVHVPGFRHGVACTRFPTDGHPDINDLLRQLTGEDDGPAETGELPLDYADGFEVAP